MFESSVSKDMKKEYHKGSGSREGSGTFMSNKELKTRVEQGRVVTTLNILLGVVSVEKLVQVILNPFMI
jgi:hypothetical protein